MPDVFLSYARADSGVAERLSDRLSAQGLSVFSDRALVAGEAFSEAIGGALEGASIVVVLLSRHSSRSKWVESELRVALESQKRVIPVLLDSEATDNWVWPLISDRVAIRLQSPEDLDAIAATISSAVFGAPRHATASHRWPWLTVAIAILSALVGFLIALWAR